MTVGIYLLGFIGTHKVYIGQSRVSIAKRFSQHKLDFIRGTHSVKLNEAYTLYGMPTCEIIEECDASILDERESYHIKLWDAVNDGFNTLVDSYGGNLEGEDSPRSLYLNKDIINMLDIILSNPKLSYAEISELSKIGENTVSQVANGVTHKWLNNVCPEKYGKLLSLKGSRINGASSAEKRGIKYPVLLSPEGVEHTVDSIQGFARKHNLCATNLCKVLHGKRNSIKGWRVKV